MAPPATARPQWAGATVTLRHVAQREGGRGRHRQGQLRSEAREATAASRAAVPRPGRASPRCSRVLGWPGGDVLRLAGSQTGLCATSGGGSPAVALVGVTTCPTQCARGKAHRTRQAGLLRGGTAQHCCTHPARRKWPRRPGSPRDPRDRGSVKSGNQIFTFEIPSATPQICIHVIISI